MRKRSKINIHGTNAVGSRIALITDKNQADLKIPDAPKRSRKYELIQIMFILVNITNVIQQGHFFNILLI